MIRPIERKIGKLLSFCAGYTNQKPAKKSSICLSFGIQVIDAEGDMVLGDSRGGSGSGSGGPDDPWGTPEGIDTETTFNIRRSKVILSVGEVDEMIKKILSSGEEEKDKGKEEKDKEKTRTVFCGSRTIYGKDENGEPYQEIQELLRIDPLGKTIRNDDFEGLSWQLFPLSMDRKSECRNPWQHHTYRAVFLEKDGFQTEKGNVLCSECLEYQERRIRLWRWLTLYGLLGFLWNFEVY